MRGARAAFRGSVRPPGLAAGALREARRVRSVLLCCLCVVLASQTAEAGQSYADHCLQPTEIHVYAGEFIYGITTFCSDGQTFHRGGQGGTKHVLRLQPGEYIRQLTGTRSGSYYGDWQMVSLQIHTTHQTSPVYGGQGGMRGTERGSQVPKGYRFAGFSIIAGDFLGDITFILEKRPDDAPMQGRKLMFFAFGSGFLASHPDDAFAIIQALPVEGLPAHQWIVERSPGYPEHFLLRNAASGLLLYKDPQTGLARAGDIRPDSPNAAWFFYESGEKPTRQFGQSYRIANLSDNTILGKRCDGIPPNADPVVVQANGPDNCWNAWTVSHLHTHTGTAADVKTFDPAQFALPPRPVSSAPPPVPAAPPPKSASPLFANSCWLAIAQDHRYDTEFDERWFVVTSGSAADAVLREADPPALVGGDVLTGWKDYGPDFRLAAGTNGSFTDGATELRFVTERFGKLRIEDRHDGRRSINYQLFRVPLPADLVRTEYTTWYTDHDAGVATPVSRIAPTMEPDDCNRLLQ